MNNRYNSSHQYVMRHMAVTTIAQGKNGSKQDLPAIESISRGGEERCVHRHSEFAAASTMIHRASRFRGKELPAGTIMDDCLDGGRLLLVALPWTAFCSQIPTAQTLQTEHV